VQNVNMTLLGVAAALAGLAVFAFPGLFAAATRAWLRFVGERREQFATAVQRRTRRLKLTAVCLVAGGCFLVVRSLSG
jgi:hypothetical protein